MTEITESLETLSDLYQYVPCGLHSLDREGVIVQVNKTEADWLGYGREELVGKRLIDLLSPESRTTFRENFPHFIALGWVRDLELELIRKDGTILPVLVSATAVRDQGGNVVMSRSIVYDLTERKRADARFRRVLEAAPDAMLICNRQGDIVLTNHQLESVFGYRCEEMQGLSLEVLLPERFRKLHMQHLAKFFAHPLTRPMGNKLELSGLRKDGTEFPVEISLSSMETDEGLQVLAAIRDVTERRRMEEEARKNETRYRLLFENSMDGILLTSPDGPILDANPSACLIFGQTREQIIAAGRGGLMDSSDPELARLIEERRSTGKAHGELTAIRADGTPFKLEVSSVVFRDIEGSERTCIIVRDVSQRKRAEAERERLIAELQEALSKVKVLSGLLSICASCKKIRDEQGHWEHLEVYIRDRSAADFSHGLCPECLKKLYPKFSPR